MTIDEMRAAHVEVRGPTMEPDPADPGRLRPTAYCGFCAAHRPDEDPRWPCETARLLALIPTADSLATAMARVASIRFSSGLEHAAAILAGLPLPGAEKGKR
jgi:hypothetical protein